MAGEKTGRKRTGFVAGGVGARTLEVKFWKKEQLRTLGVESEAPGAEEIRTLISWVSHPGVVATRARGGEDGFEDRPGMHSLVYPGLNLSFLICDKSPNYFYPQRF